MTSRFLVGDKFFATSSEALAYMKAHGRTVCLYQIPADFANGTGLWLSYEKLLTW